MATVKSSAGNDFTVSMKGCYEDWRDIRQNDSDDYRRGFYDGFREVVWLFFKALPPSVRENMMCALYRELDAEEPMLS